VVNDDYSHVVIGADIWVKLREEHPDYYLVLELEAVSGFKCRRREYRVARSAEGRDASVGPSGP
jgi:hypothetical protein